ncbi:MAG: GAF domain-containing protein [Desulfobacterales bacterium]|nr:GAF domain-containing protein [Desulfobacterales bacterium]
MPDSTHAELTRRIKALEAELSRRDHELESGQRARKNHKRFLRFLPYPVLIRDGNHCITYVNPAFTHAFGWTLAEVRGKVGDDHVPHRLKDELPALVRALTPEKTIIKLTTRRLTKSGKLRDVVIRVGVDKDESHRPTGMILVYRDVTMELRNQKTKATMNRISKALPHYPQLKRLSRYVGNEIKEMLDVEGANIILLNESGDEFYFLSAAHDDPGTRERIQKSRFPVGELVAGQVVKTGEPVIMSSLPQDQELHRNRNEKIGYIVKNLMVVPLKTKERIIGVITADNKKEGEFDQGDLEFLNTLAATVALSIENARISEDLARANLELQDLNTAKDKMISHLSHELKTPTAILLSAVKILSRKLAPLPSETWEPTLDRIRRNLNRIVGIEDEVYDIVEKKEFLHTPVFSLIFDQCQDVIQSLIAEETGDTDLVKRIRERIDQSFNATEAQALPIQLDTFTQEVLQTLSPEFKRRRIKLEADLPQVSDITIPQLPLEKTLVGLLRNAVENTPDQGRIQVQLRENGQGIQLDILDHGTGISPRVRERIFQGFYNPRETLDYSSGQPFDFNAGGKGADLLRMKIFSERHHFKIEMDSRRCSRLPRDADICPGTIEGCRDIPSPALSPGDPCDGWTRVRLTFPKAH